MTREEARAALGFSNENRIVLFNRGGLKDRDKGLGLVNEGIKLAEKTIAWILAYDQENGASFGSD